MTVTSNLPKDLHGKQISICYATLSMDIKFGLWKDHNDWILPNEYPELWYDLDILKKTKVTVEIMLDNKIVEQQTFDNFETVHIYHEFEDSTTGACDLTIKVVNLSNLPIRDDTGVFAAGMIEIQSLELQGIEIKHLLENTFLGNDTALSLPVSRPVYNWMIEQRKKILPDFF